MELVAKRVGASVAKAPKLARSWATIGHATSPHEGAIVVWKRGRGGHVGIITNYLGNGKAVVISGNDGRRVRERVRVVSNALAIRGL